MDRITKAELEELISLPFKATDQKPILVPIKSAHISGISYLNIGDAGIALLSEFVNSGLTVSVPTTMNPGFVEVSDVTEKTCDDETFQKQMQIIELLKKLGITPSLTCIPYFQGNVPEPGDHLAWAESSAVLYVNSIIGAWSNKESGIGALASAIMGFAADIGVHRPEGRRPELRVRYEGTLSNELEAGALGYLIGKRAGDKIHYIEADGIEKGQGRIIEYLAAFGTSGLAPIASIKGISPIQPEQSGAGLEELFISEKQVKSTIEELSSENEPEAIVIGCPHAGFDVLRTIVEHDQPFRVPTFVFSSASVKGTAAKAGLIKRGGKVGIRVVADSCIMWCGLRTMGITAVVTNSVKAAYYLSHQMKIKVKLKPLNEILGGNGID